MRPRRVARPLPARPVCGDARKELWVTQSSLILTLIGPDRPGLVRILAELVAERGGSWLESRMARLAGQFAGIVLVERAAPPRSTALTEALEELQDQGLRVTMRAGRGRGAPAGCRPSCTWKWWGMTGPASCATSPRRCGIAG